MLEILLVESDELQGRMLSQTCKAGGRDVDWQTDHRYALEDIGKRTILVLDLDDGFGFERFIEAAHERGFVGQIVGLLSIESSASLSKTLYLDVYLLKPFDPAQLVSVLARMLDEPKLAREMQQMFEDQFTQYEAARARYSGLQDELREFLAHFTGQISANEAAITLRDLATLEGLRLTRDIAFAEYSLAEAKIMKNLLQRIPTK